MSERDRTAILALIRAQEAAIARSDSQGGVAAIAEGAVLFDLPPPLQVRGDAAAGIADLEGWFATWENGVTVELADPTILVDRDLAVVFGLSRMRGSKRDAGPLDQWNRRTIVLRRTGGDWRIVHEHSSYPMRMDGSDKVAVDLKPE